MNLYTAGMCKSQSCACAVIQDPRTIVFLNTRLSPKYKQVKGLAYRAVCENTLRCVSVYLDTVRVQVFGYIQVYTNTF